MISLEASTRTCKVDTASAARIESDRFLNPNLVVCPVWNGYDLAGRPVCADSFYTKRSGCNSAMDRVVVENNLRPQYFDYINLSDEGIRSNIFGDNMSYTDAGIANIQEANTHRYTGRYGMVSGSDMGGTFQSTCSYGKYNEAMKQRDRQVARNCAQPTAMNPGNGEYQAAPGHFPKGSPSVSRSSNIRRFNPSSKQSARGNAMVTNNFRNANMLYRSGN